MTDLQDDAVARPDAVAADPAMRPADPAMLPPEYDQALAVAQRILEATRLGDRAAVDALRAGLPALAASLARRWQTLLAADPQAARRLEPARIAAIRRVLAVDDRIRRLESPRLAATGDLIGGTPLPLPRRPHPVRPS